MARILLIPGYATKLRVPLFRPHGLGQELGFTGYRSLLKSHEAKVVDWGLPQRLTWWRVLSPWSYHRAYRAEERFMQTPEAAESVRNAILEECPEIIVAHSMGAKLLGRVLEKESFLFLRTVHFVSSDDNYRSPLLQPGPEIVHHYCWWDVTLWLSSIIHADWRSGLWPSPNRDRQNQWLWLIRPLNLHTAPLRSPRFARKVSST